LSDYVIQNQQFRSIQDIVDSFGGSGVRIDLGSGYAKPDGFIGIDNLSGESAQIPTLQNMPDILMDINKFSIPFGENTCVEVRASHFLEHSDIDHVVNETFRILKPHGVFIIAVPYANSAEGMYPGHNVFLTEKFFYENINFQKKFRITKESYFPSSEYLKLPFLLRMIIPFRFARIFLFNACWQMILRCVVRK
jgi:SAM-dependent methyltransferase